MAQMNCPGCGAPVPADGRHRSCEYCGTALMAADEVDLMKPDEAEDAGYRFEKGRQRAREELRREQEPRSQQTAAPAPPKKKHTFWWVIGWIFCFPIPLTILIVRSKKMPVWLKVLLLILLWAAVYGSGKSTAETEAESNKINHIGSSYAASQGSGK